MISILLIISVKPIDTQKKTVTNNSLNKMLNVTLYATGNDNW